MRSVRLVLLTALLWIVSTAQAQNAQPAIISFSADIAAISVNDAEAGETQATLAWHVINLAQDQSLRIDQRSLGAWVPVVPDEEALLPVGSLLLPVQHPLDFGPVTYRLLLLNGEDGIVDERYLSIPYEKLEDSPPVIELFTTSTATILGEALSDGSARVNVDWAVANRPPMTNLRFVQRMEDGQFVPVELPRENLWVSSSGSGVVAPVPPLSGSLINIALQVVDVISGEVYAEASQEIAVGGAVAAQPTTEAETTDPAIAVTAQAGPTPCSISVVDVPLDGAPGDGCDRFTDPESGTTTRVLAFDMTSMDEGSISLSWEIEGAQLALLEIYAPEQLAQGGLPDPPAVTQDGLPTVGSTSIILPGSLNNGARIILWAANLSTEARSPSSLYDRLAYRIIDIEGDRIESDAEITAFIALPPAAPAGSEITLSWNIRGAETGLIELYDLETGALVGIFEDLPPIGSANIVIPAGFTQGVRFVLWATNQGEDGDFLRLAQAELEVLPS